MRNSSRWQNFYRGETYEYSRARVGGLRWLSYRPPVSLSIEIYLLRTSSFSIRTYYGMISTATKFDFIYFSFPAYFINEAIRISINNSIYTFYVYYI